MLNRYRTAIRIVQMLKGWVETAVHSPGRLRARIDLDVRRLDEINRIERSGLFHAQWYLSRYADLKGVTDPVAHFFNIGAAEGRNPNPLFHSRWYADRYLSGNLAAQNPLLHYISSDWTEERDPNPLFQTQWYYSSYPETCALNKTALLDYLASGAIKSRDPNPYFSSAWMLKLHPELTSRALNPLEYYFEHGAHDERPSIDFDARWYLAANPAVAKAGYNPLVHFLTHGLAEGRAPNPLRANEKPGELVEAAAIMTLKPMGGIRADEVVLVVAHAPNGRLKPHVCPHLDALIKEGLEVVLIVASDTPVHLENDLLKTLLAVYVRENRGFDFAAWAHTLSLNPELFDVPLLLFINDSIIGPRSQISLHDTLTRIRACPADVIGLTESEEHTWHIQSYFFALRAAALQNVLLQSFWMNVRNLPNKTDVILSYEVRLAAIGTRAGLKCDVIFKTDRPDNPTIFNWKKLLDAGFPYVKRLLAEGYYNDLDVSDLRRELTNRGFSILSADLDSAGHGLNEPKSQFRPEKTYGHSRSTEPNLPALAGAVDQRGATATARDQSPAGDMERDFLAFFYLEEDLSPPEPFSVGFKSTGASDWVAFVPRNAEVRPEFGAIVEWHIHHRPSVDIFYADDEYIPPVGEAQLRIKPAFNRALLISQDYIGMPVIVRASVLQDLGGLRPNFRTASVYDLQLRALSAGFEFGRICEVLVSHTHPYPVVTLDDRRKALEAWLHQSAGGFEIGAGLTPGSLALCRQFTDFPTVTVLITGDGADRPGDSSAPVFTLLKSLASSTWPADQLKVVVGSDLWSPLLQERRWPFDVEPVAFEQKSDRDLDPVERWNLLWRASESELIVLMRDSVVVESVDWLQALMTFAMDEAIGAVGARILDDHGGLKDVGMMGGPFETFSNVWGGQPVDTPTYQDWALVQRDWSATSGIVLATRRSIMQALNGFDEAVGAAYAGADLCLRMGASGYRTVYVPQATFIMGESRSKDGVIPGSQTAIFHRRWRDVITEDPMGHPRFARDSVALFPT